MKEIIAFMMGAVFGAASLADIYLILAKRGNKDSEDNEDEW